MRNRKLVNALALTMAISVVLGGCGSAATPEPAGEAGTPAGNETENTEETQESDSKNITLKVFDSMAYATDEYQKVIDQFELDHPGVTVEIQHAANDGATILQSRFNSGDIPDVFLNEPGSGAQLYYEYAYDWSGDTDILAKFNDDAISLAKDGDAVYGLPWTYETMALIYNKDCFDKAGITELPTTVEELDEACRKLQEAGIQPFAMAGKENWVLGQLATHFIMEKELDAQGTVEALISGEKKISELPHWQNFFKFLDIVKKYDSSKILETSWEDSENKVANGEAAMLHMGDWAQANFTKMNPDARLAFLPVPVGGGAEDCTVLSSVGWVFQIYKDSENLSLAKEYCDYVLTSEAGAEWMTEGVDAVPASNAQPDYAPSGDLPKDSQKYIQEGKTNGWIHTISGSGYGDAVGPYVQGYLIDSYTEEEVTQGFQDYFDSLG